MRIMYFLLLQMLEKNGACWSMCGRKSTYTLERWLGTLGEEVVSTLLVVHYKSFLKFAGYWQQNFLLEEILAIIESFGKMKGGGFNS